MRTIKTDQTARILRHIEVFAGHTCEKVRTYSHAATHIVSLFIANVIWRTTKLHFIYNISDLMFASQGQRTRIRRTRTNEK